MTASWRTVAGGLRTARLALRCLIAMALLLGGLTLATGVGGVGEYLRTNPVAGNLLIGFIAVVALGVFAGWVGGFVGRCRCLATPSDHVVARTRIRLATLLEGYGLLSGVVNVGVAVCAGWLIPIPLEVPFAVGGTSLLALVSARMIFLGYLRTLALHIGEVSLLDLVSRSLLVFVIVSGCGATGIILFSLTRLFPEMTYSTAGSFAGAVGCGLWLAAVMVGAYGQLVYGRLLRQAEVSVRQLAGSDAP